MRRLLIAVAVLVCPLAQAEGTHSAGAYKWVDEKGMTHYGDRIPPEYAKRERAVLNSQGVEVRRMEAQRTPEQVAEDQRKAQLQQQQHQHDTFLLTTYQSARDIEQLRDARLQQLGDQRRSTEAYIESLNGRLSVLQTRASAFRPYSTNPNARQMPDDMAEDLVRTMNEVRVQRSGLAQKRKEEDAMRALFDADVARYKLLKLPVASTR